MVDQDSKARIKELEEVLGKHRAAREEAKRERETIAAKKRRIERERNSAFTAYDTAYLSTELVKEREHASLMQEIESLHALTKFPQLLETQKRQLEKLILNESTLRNQLKEARAIAEQDTGGLDRLKDSFLTAYYNLTSPE